MSSVQKTAEKLDIEYERIQHKADQAEQIAAEKGVELEETAILPNFDMNGPIVDKETVDYSLNSGARASMGFLEHLSKYSLSMLSGWDVNTLKFVAEDRLGIEMDHVGELGSIAVIDGESMKTVNADYDEIIDFRRNLLLEAAADGLTINEQGNISPLTGCTYVEGHRKGVFENHPIAARSAGRFSIENLYEEVREKDVESIAIGDEDVRTGLPSRLRQETGEYLAIDLKDDQAVDALTETITREYPLIGLELEYVGGQEIRITANTDESTAISDENLLNYFQRFMDGVAKDTVFETDHNPDLSTDYQRKDVEISKEHGANFRAEQIVGDEEYLLLNVGDKPGDVLEGDNTLFFAQKGYPAEKYVEENDIESVKVESATDYALITAELIERHE